MLKFDKGTFVDIEKYEERINVHRFIYVDLEKLRRLVEFETARKDTLAALTIRTMKWKSDGKSSNLDKDVIIYHLTKFEGCPPQKFRKKNVEVSLDLANVMEPLAQSGYAQEFFSTYLEYASIKSKVARASKLHTHTEPSELLSSTGQKLSRMYFRAEQKQNLRFNYNNTDIISIPYEYTASFAVPEDEIMAWGDFAQSDLRIVFNLLLRDEFNGPIMDKYADKYEGMAAILAAWAGEKHDHDKFLEERELYKVNVLSGIYGQEHGSTPEDQAFISRLQKYLKTCPRYQEYRKRIKDCFELGLPIQVTGYFGHEEIITRPTEKDTLNKALNTPAQTGTSEIVILTCNAILDKFYSLGYTSDDISLYITRHDEPIFRFKKHVLKDAWVFNDASTIMVDDWTPLRLDFSYGTYYGTEDPVITQQVRDVYDANADKYSVYEPNKERIDYVPALPVRKLYIGTEVVGKQTIICIYCRDSNKAAYFLADTNVQEEVDAVIREKCLSTSEDWGLKYRGVMVYTTGYREDAFADIRYRFAPGNNEGCNLASLLAHWKGSKYAEREAIPFAVNQQNIDINIELLRGVGVLDEIQD